MPKYDSGILLASIIFLGIVIIRKTVKDLKYCEKCIAFIFMDKRIIINQFNHAQVPACTYSQETLTIFLPSSEWERTSDSQFSLTVTPDRVTVRLQFLHSE